MGMNAIRGARVRHVLLSPSLLQASPIVDGHDGHDNAGDGSFPVRVRSSSKGSKGSSVKYQSVKRKV